MGEELKNQNNRLEIESGSRLPELQLLFTLKPGMDRRRYNVQRTNEVAAVFYTTADGEIPESYVTIRRRLFQQWLVDSYVKIEKDRIDYCKTHQKELRSETYQGLRDYLQTMANDLNGRIGKMVILPSTFIGSPRNMLQNYQDAMAIVSKFGKPDLFITMTCIPKWREIEENLLPGQQACDRPDICARVFNIKKDYLLDLIVKQKFFGEVAAFVYVIEFQKRGLPHVHILITLKYNFKITTPQIVDKYISAEIPDPNENRILHDIVMRHMIHGPCGDWCLVDGKCSKNYPKPYHEETRRMKMLILIIVDEIMAKILNFLVDIYIKSVKYLYKYIYKGHDVAAITIEPVTENVTIDHDEIHNYIEARYVGPVEASWRILVKGSTSFNDLRTVDGKLHPSFSAACLALGLIEDDDEWKRAMNEAVGWMMPRQLRRLFVRILLHCQPLHPEELWENFKVAMSEDYVRHFGMLKGQNKAYVQINNILRAEGKNFVDFPQMEQLIEDIEEEDYETLEKAMEIARIRQKRVCTMAFTGIAATLLPTGKTVHKIFGLPVPLFADSSSSIKIQSKEAQYLKEIDIFIWNEAPMAPRYALEIMDRTLRDIMNNDFPFGGKVILLGGDFRQLLPIKVHATRKEIEFAKFVLDIGDGTLNDFNDNIQIPEYCIASNNADIVEDIYGDLIRKTEFIKMSKCAILSARNVDVDEINKKVVELLDITHKRIYTSVDSAINNDNGDISETLLPEYLNSLSPPSLPPHELRLRPNCIIMLISLSINEGLCNEDNFQ
ncbi:uncharacterized protein LOC112638349 [Camponotus floridanus]|uniref:uncharacterized protein LOC112638349 n=1 Tax=Camponotus floridanus TaxID=104421 RepID=UPI000DC6C3FD|nr:uncharacterized protein LOC112638349 [Camponotus floridanus]